MVSTRITALAVIFCALVAMSLTFSFYLKVNSMCVSQASRAEIVQLTTHTVHNQLITGSAHELIDQNGLTKTDSNTHRSATQASRAEVHVTNILHGMNLSKRTVHNQLMTGSAHELRDLNGLKKTDPNECRFITLSASVNEVVHSTPYSLLLPLTARSWVAAGFRPIILLVVHLPVKWRATRLAKLLMSELESIRHCKIFILPSPTRFIEVSLAQVSRLFVSLLLPESERDTYLRISDADMIVYQGWPFQTENITGVHIFNGNCCLPQRPMHSIGMTVQLWRQLFSPLISMESAQCSPAELSERLVILLNQRGIQSGKPMAWAQKPWSLDQILAGQIINNMKGIRLTVSPSVGRVHFPHHALIEGVVESHEHKITVSQLPNLQKRIDLSNLRLSEPFQNWNWTRWVEQINRQL